MLVELVPKYGEEFANFNIFVNRLDDFVIPLLSAKIFTFVRYSFQSLYIDILFELRAVCCGTWVQRK